MSQSERTNRMLERARRGDANIGEIEECIAATRADLDRNLSAIQQRLSPDQLVNQAVDYLRDGPTEFLSNFGRTVKANPVPVALLSVSLGWLMLAGRHPSNGRSARVYGDEDWDQEGEYSERSYASRQYADSDYSTGESSGQSYGLVAPSLDDRPGVAQRVREAVHDRTENLSERASHLSDRASHLAERASGLGHRLGDKLSEVTSKMSDVSKRSHHALHNAREGISRAGSTLNQQQRRIREGYQDFAEHHPFVLGAVAFAVGAAIAASLRPSRLEDRVMGDLRDQAVDDAGTRARAELQRGVSSVRSALEEQHDVSDEHGEVTGSTVQSAEKMPDEGVAPYNPDRIH